MSIWRNTLSLLRNQSLYFGWSVWRRSFQNTWVGYLSIMAENVQVLIRRLVDVHHPLLHVLAVHSFFFCVLRLFILNKKFRAWIRSLSQASWFSRVFICICVILRGNYFHFLWDQPIISLHLIQLRFQFFNDLLLIIIFFLQTILLKSKLFESILQIFQIVISINLLIINICIVLIMRILLCSQNTII